jgi:hypothetical protein
LDTDDFCTFFDFSTAVLELNRRSIVTMKSIYKSLSTGTEESVYVQMGDITEVSEASKNTDVVVDHLSLPERVERHPLMITEVYSSRDTRDTSLKNVGASSNETMWMLVNHRSTLVCRETRRWCPSMHHGKLSIYPTGFL